MATSSADNQKRYLLNLREERESTALYRGLAEIEKDSRLAEIYRRMADVESRHAATWADMLSASGQTPPPDTTGTRVRVLLWMAKRFGAGAVLPIIASSERGASQSYDAQPEARAAGMPADERS
ncbi:MAG TPA: hypothetical protein VFN78_02070, partial [Ktedonobacterales bacterium]|nr:hypothetical protein [Ktedonobacterales bacterium]